MTMDHIKNDLLKQLARAEQLLVESAQHVREANHILHSINHTVENIRMKIQIHELTKVRE